MRLKTQRLELIALDSGQLGLLLNGTSEFEKVYDCSYQGEELDGVFGEVINDMLSLAKTNKENGIWNYVWLILRSYDRVVVGSVTFKGKPNTNGEVELGYGLGTEFWHQGYMTETVRKLSAWALEQDDVTAVIAETEIQNEASQRILKRCNFVEYARNETVWWRLKEVLETDSILDTKRVFEKCFSIGVELYEKQTKDEDQLQKIMNCLPIEAGMKVLDLGTGTGYLAFGIAQHNLDVQIVGLDIVEDTLERNRCHAKEEQLSNIQFVAYEGSNFPFQNETFDIVVTRYALHHFPKIEYTFREIERVLKKGGHFFVSDPTPNREDTCRFVDAFMQMKKDGHIKFYTKDEWKAMGEKVGLHIVDSFETFIRFPKNKSKCLELDEILKLHHPDIVKGYDLLFTDEEVYITEKVNNILFHKSSV